MLPYIVLGWLICSVAAWFVQKKVDDRGFLVHPVFRGLVSGFYGFIALGILSLIFALKNFISVPPPEVTRVAPTSQPVVDEPKFQVVLKINRLDAKSLIKGMQVKKEDQWKNQDGEIIQRWVAKAPAQRHLNFEIIGQDLSDADRLVGRCDEYNSEGNLTQWNSQSGCYPALVKLLSNVAEKPEALGAYLLGKSKLEAKQHSIPNGAKGVVRAGQFQISLEDDGYFAIRTMTSS